MSVASENADFVDAWIEHESQERTREFRKYWERKTTPQNKIEDLIRSNPDRAAEIIVAIAEKIESNEDLQTKLICGLLYDFEHHEGDTYEKLILKRLANLEIHQYLRSDKV